MTTRQQPGLVMLALRT